MEILPSFHRFNCFKKTWERTAQFAEENERRQRNFTFNFYLRDYLQQVKNSRKRVLIYNLE